MPKTVSSVCKTVKDLYVQRFCEPALLKTSWLFAFWNPRPNRSNTSAWSVSVEPYRTLNRNNLQTFSLLWVTLLFCFWLLFERAIYIILTSTFTVSQWIIQRNINQIQIEKVAPNFKKYLLTWNFIYILR